MQARMKDKKSKCITNQMHFNPGKNSYTYPRRSVAIEAMFQKIMLANGIRPSDR